MKKRLILRKPSFNKGGVIKRQEGGAMPEEQAPAQQTLEQMLTQYAEGRSPEVAVMIADMILEQFMQTQNKEAQAAPVEETAEEAPMGRRGMMMNPYR